MRMRIQKYMLLLIFGLVSCSVISGNSTQYFVYSNNQVYYPASTLSLTLINLHKDTDYSLLIGANQNSYDYQWINFTAIEIETQISFIHFNHQSMKDNTSADIKNLLIVLYSNNTQLDFLWFKVQSYANDFNISGLFLLVFGSASLFVSILIAYSITKYIIVKLL